MRVAVKIEVRESDRKQLERWPSSRSVPVRLRERSLVVLKASVREDEQGDRGGHGLGGEQGGLLAAALRGGRTGGIRKERRRGDNQGGRSDAEREALRGRIVELTTTGLPRDATQWSSRTMAREVGASRDSVSATWRTNGLKPHLSRTFKLSADPGEAASPSRASDARARSIGAFTGCVGSTDAALQALAHGVGDCAAP